MLNKQHYLLSNDYMGIKVFWRMKQYNVKHIG